MKQRIPGAPGGHQGQGKLSPEAQEPKEPFEFEWYLETLPARMAGRKHTTSPNAPTATYRFTGRAGPRLRRALGLCRGPSKNAHLETHPQGGGLGARGAENKQQQQEQS